MATIKKGLLNGEEIVRHYSSSHKRKIYFHLQPTAATSTATATSTQETDVVDLTQMPPANGAATRQLLTAMAQRAGVCYEDVFDEGESSDVDVDCIMTNPSSSAASNHQKDHIKVLSWEPDVVGDIVEDLSTFGFPEKEREKEGWGRLEEVAFWSKKASDATKNKIQLPPFMTHTLDEMLWQAREQFAVCLLILFSVSNTSNDFVDLLFKIINNQLKKLRGKVFVWVADTHSDEGSKVQAKYGVGDQTTLLVVVPSHIPQGIDSFNETTLDERKVKEALENAQQLLSRLENIRMDLARATWKGQEKSRKGGTNFTPTREIPFEKSDAKHDCHDDEDENVDDEDTEVAFGPVCGGEILEETVEDDVDEGIERKTKKKRKKKKSKKNRKNKHKDGPVEVGEPSVKTAKRDD